MDIASWCNQTVTVRQRSGVGADGNPTYGTASSWAARVTRKTKAIVGAGGETLNASHHVTVLDELNEADQIKLPGASDYRRPIEVKEGRDKAGNVTHYEVWL